jgi:hypothetical protein
MLLFSEARFQFRQLRGGRPGDLFGTNELDILESPEPGKTTGDMLARAEQDASFAGNWFGYRVNGQIKRLRPDWMGIVTGSYSQDLGADDPEAELVGYVYVPGGPGSGNDPIPLLRQQVAHYAPIPDPLSRHRGMSWLTPIIREIMADSAARDHKIKFFEKGGTTNTVFRIDPASMSKEQFESFVGKFRAQEENPANAYSKIFIRAAADPTVIGADFKQMDFKEVQGAGETRIAAAAGVPPIIVGLSEGLASATYSNYGQARRRFADGTMRPLWRNMAGSLQSIIAVPTSSELWYDDRDIPFLQEDRKDAAEVQQMQSVAIKTLVDAGYDTQSVIDAITSGDLSRLQHTGLVSVQLQEPGVLTSASNGSNGKSQIALPKSLQP